MNLESFFASLMEGGTLRVPAPAARGETPKGLENALREADAVARLEMPGRAPALDVEAWAWAAGRMLAACQGLVYREMGEAEVRAALGVPCPQGASASVCYSVDLAMRRLPDVYSLARGLAQEDPLVEKLAELAREWPLSSVGVRMGEAMEWDVNAFIGDASLRRLYADRIIERGDVARLSDARVIEAVREALGAYADLAPAAIAARLHDIETASVEK